MNGKIKLVGIALVVALVVGLLGAAAVSAQDGEDGALANFFGRGPGRMGGRGTGALVESAEMHEAIAEALGISVEELEAAQADGTPLFALVEEMGLEMTAVREAMESVRLGAVDRALAEGAISDGQAQWMRDGRGPWRHGGGGPGGPFHGEGAGMNLVDADTMHAAIAEALGISVEELEAARAEGASLVALAEELGVEMETVRAAMETVREDAINQALADGEITEEQADWLRSRPAFGHGPMGGNGPFGGQGSCDGEGPHSGRGPGGGNGMGGNGRFGPGNNG